MHSKPGGLNTASLSPHRNGFMRLDIMRERGVLLRVYRYTNAGRGGLAYSAWLEPLR